MYSMGGSRVAPEPWCPRVAEFRRCVDSTSRNRERIELANGRFCISRIALKAYNKFRHLRGGHRSSSGPVMLARSHCRRCVSAIRDVRFSHTCSTVAVAA